MSTAARRRSPKLTAIVLLVLAGGLALLAATQQWFTLTISPGTGGAAEIGVDGSVAAPALTALAFAALALAAALAIAGPVIRLVLGILAVLLGASVVLAAAIAIGDPVAAGAPLVTKATGVAGQDSVAALVTDIASTAWPWVAVAAGVIIAALGIAVLVTSRRWPASSRRYQAVRMEPAERSPKDVAVDEWDELSRGDDPTA